MDNSRIPQLMLTWAISSEAVGVFFELLLNSKNYDGTLKQVRKLVGAAKDLMMPDDKGTRIETRLNTIEVEFKLRQQKLLALAKQVDLFLKKLDVNNNQHGWMLADKYVEIVSDWVRQLTGIDFHEEEIGVSSGPNGLIYLLNEQGVFWTLDIFTNDNDEKLIYFSCDYNNGDETVACTKAGTATQLSLANIVYNLRQCSTGKMIEANGIFFPGEDCPGVIIAEDLLVPETNKFTSFKDYAYSPPPLFNSDNLELFEFVGESILYMTLAELNYKGTASLNTLLKALAYNFKFVFENDEEKLELDIVLRNILEKITFAELKRYARGVGEARLRTFYFFLKYNGIDLSKVLKEPIPEKTLTEWNQFRQKQLAGSAKTWEYWCTLGTYAEFKLEWKNCGFDTNSFKSILFKDISENEIVGKVITKWLDMGKEKRLEQLGYGHNVEYILEMITWFLHYPENKK